MKLQTVPAFERPFLTQTFHLCRVQKVYQTTKPRCFKRCSGNNHFKIKIQGLDFTFCTTQEILNLTS